MVYWHRRLARPPLQHRKASKAKTMSPHIHIDANPRTPSRVLLHIQRTFEMTKRNNKPAFVVFGKKGPRLPHAAWFDLSDARVRHVT